MIVEDDRTDEQKRRLTVLIVGTDRFMSGWGLAKGGSSVAAWACGSNWREVLNEIKGRSDMKRVRMVYDSPRKYRPRNAAHFHIYTRDPQEG